MTLRSLFSHSSNEKWLLQSSADVLSSSLILCVIFAAGFSNGLPHSIQRQLYLGPFQNLGSVISFPKPFLFFLEYQLSSGHGLPRSKKQNCHPDGYGRFIDFPAIILHWFVAVIEGRDLECWIKQSSKQQFSVDIFSGPCLLLEPCDKIQWDLSYSIQKLLIRKALT